MKEYFLKNRTKAELRKIAQQLGIKDLNKTPLNDIVKTLSKQPYTKLVKAFQSI